MSDTPRQCACHKRFINDLLDDRFSDIITPARNTEDHSSTIIGVFGCLRVILPHICKPPESQDVEAQRTDNLLHMYELCLHYTKWHSDHNIINAALETLAQLLKTPPKSLVFVLLSSEGIPHSRIISNQNVCTLSLGQTSISSTSTAYGGNSDSTLNLHEPDVPEVATNIDKWIVDAETTSPPASCNLQTQSECASDVIETKGKILESYCGLKIGAIDSKHKHVNVIRNNNFTNISFRWLSDELVEEGSDVGSEIEKSERAPSLQSEQLREDCSEEATLSYASPKKCSVDFILYEADVGSFTDSDMPLKFCCRHLVSSFLLAGKPGHLISDKLFRVSVKSLALTCVGYMLKLYPHLFTMSVAKEPSRDEKNQLIEDILLFADHPDPQIRGNIAVVVGIFLKSVFVQYGGSFESFEREACSTLRENASLLEDLIKLLLKVSFHT